MSDRELKKIENDKKVVFCYIMKHGSYYRPNSCGYTERLFWAGVYPKADAVSKARSCRDLDLIPIDVVKHNTMIVQESQEILSHYIKN